MNDVNNDYYNAMLDDMNDYNTTMRNTIEPKHRLDFERVNNAFNSLSKLVESMQKLNAQQQCIQCSSFWCALIWCTPCPVMVHFFVAALPAPHIF